MSSSESIQSPSRLITGTTCEAEIDKNVDSLFRVYTIAEVSTTLKKLKYTGGKAAVLTLW